MNKKLAWAVALVLSGSVQAQVVPEIDKTAAVEMFDVVERQSQLDETDRRALALANEWKNNGNKPMRSDDGTVLYGYGLTMPVVLCATFRVCMLRLQEGEYTVEDIEVGDPAWEPKPLVVGPKGKEVLMIAVKPKVAGMVTNMVVNTNRRSYNVILKSTKDKWVPVTGFYYPDDAKKAWEKYKRNQARAEYASTLPNGQSASRMDFEYKITGEGPWRPVRVYNNGRITTIQFASSEFNHGAPTLFEIGQGNGWFDGEVKEVINYNPFEDTYVVDGLPQKMALVSGVGKAEKRVTIEYVGKNR